MAVRTVSILGGNWNAVTAWTGGVVPIAGDTVDFTATSGNLTVNVSTALLAGVDFTNYVNTITFSQSINTNGTVNLGTGGYTQAGSNGLVINGTTTISGTTVLNNIFLSNNTITLTSDLNCQNLTVATGGSPTINNSGGNVNVNGNLTNAGGGATLGTASINLIGTGTWSQSGGIQNIRNNLNINTTGIITISGLVYYGGATLTYISGTMVVTDSTLSIGLSTTLNTSGMFWNNITIPAGIHTLTSDLNCQNFTASASITINGLFNINVSGNITASGITQGTSTIVLIGTGLWTALNGSNTFRTPIIINTNGIITLANSLFHDGNLTFTNGVVISKNTTINFGSTLKTLTNLHKIVFKNIILDVGITTTMNEFFSGSPELVTNISSSTTANYIIAFQDRFEKISKFVNITNCTLSNPQQLLVITNSLRSSTNKGIRYINQSPNGIAKGDATILNTMTASAGGYVKDPNMK